MPAYSRFHREATIEPATGVASTGERLATVHVGGPMVFDLKPEYDDVPVVVSFVVIQSPEGEHGPLKAKRVRGVVVARAGDSEWNASVQFPEAWLRNGEARGVGVAVVEQPDQFAYQSFTWCDHIKIVTANGAGETADAADKAGTASG